MSELSRGISPDQKETHVLPDSVKPESRLTLNELSPEVKPLAINLSQQILRLCRLHEIEVPFEIAPDNSNLSEAVSIAVEKYIEKLEKNPALMKDAEKLLELQERLTTIHETNKTPEEKEGEFHVVLGQYKTAEAYIKAFELNGCQMTPEAKKLLQKVEFSNKETVLHLKTMTVSELGFPNGGMIEQIYSSIHAIGGELCPAEVGPALRLLFKNQPKSEWLYCSMNAISVSDGGLRVFSLNSDSGGLWLGADGSPGDRFNADYRVVFAVPAQVS